TKPRCVGRFRKLLVSSGGAMVCAIDGDPTQRARRNAMSKNTLVDRLNENRLRKALINHEFFRRVKASPMSREQVAVFIGQWWHPLHYFPTFLARSVSVVPDIESKCAISTILNEEAGEGNPKRAHEVIYVDTMERVGFTKRQATESAPFRETKTLVDGYARPSQERLATPPLLLPT